MSARPNFLFIITDQHRADHLGCYGNGILETPHIDSIAARGRVFDRFYVANPVCMPNRATLLTGRMPSVNGVRCNGIPLPLTSNTFIDLLRAAGYRTALLGKSHVQNMTGKPALATGEPLPEERAAPAGPLADARRPDAPAAAYAQESPAAWRDDPEFVLQLPYYGFDRVDLCTGHGDEVGGDYARWLAARHPDPESLRGPAHALPHDYSCPQAWRTALPEELYPTRYVTDRALEFLDAHAAGGSDAPFFACVSYPDPHHPFTPPGRYWDRYDPDAIPLPPSYHSDLPRSPTVRWAYRQRKLEKQHTGGQNLFAIGERHLQEAIALTYGQIAMIDDQVARLLARLDSLGLADNTVVVFTSDHGDLMGDHQLILKGPIHFQGLVRVPFIWADPQAPASVGRSSALAGTLDIAGTVLDRAGLLPYHGMQGRSLLPEIGGARDRGPGSVLIEAEDQRAYFDLPAPTRVRTLVTATHRLTIYQGADWGDLYDLENDPHELHNLWDDPASATVRAAMVEQLAYRQMELADSSPPPSALA